MINERRNHTLTKNSLSTICLTMAAKFLTDINLRFHMKETTYMHEGLSCKNHN